MLSVSLCSGATAPELDEEVEEAVGSTVSILGAVLEVVAVVAACGELASPAVAFCEGWVEEVVVAVPALGSVVVAVSVLACGEPACGELACPVEPVCSTGVETVESAVLVDALSSRALRDSVVVAVFSTMTAGVLVAVIASSAA